MADVTQILSEIQAGDPCAAERLLPLVYDELRKLAAAKLAHEKPGQTLQATALVHDAYLRLVGGDQSEEDWDGRRHFFAAAAEAMRRILVDQARKKGSLRAGGDRRRVPLTAIGEAAQPQLDILALNDALTQFEVKNPRAAKVVKLRFFVGMTIQETADAIGISVATAKKEWAYAKTWLHAALTDGAPGS